TGPSGSGKTTLFKLFFREELPTHGHILLDGVNVRTLAPRDVPAFRRKIGVGALERRARAHRMLRLVGLEHKLHEWPRHLSGGEKQRVAIARALVGDP